MSNATLGLELVYKEAGLSGGEVIVPSHTFVATVHALERVGCRPVFCDVDPRTHTIDPEALESLVTPRTKGIVAVHLWGRPAAVDALERLAGARGLKLIFDAAHAFGCSVGARPIGRAGFASVFSFHATKVLNSFEGGAVTTLDGDLAERLRRARNFGFSGEDVLGVGTNAKMPEVSAAMGLVNLEAVDGFIAVNRRNHQAYHRVLDGLPGLSLLPFSETDRPNYQYVVVEVDAVTAGLTRDELMAVLHAENVVARRYFWPGVHRLEPYRTTDPAASSRLPQTERLASRVLVLPTGTGVTEAQIAVIGQILRAALVAPERVRSADRIAGDLRQVLR
jgi:dTDP-4-amino-4,6-dideoxygalactose transaminase